MTIKMEGSDSMTKQLQHHLLEKLVHVVHLQLLKSNASSYNKLIAMYEVANNFNEILLEYDIKEKEGEDG